MPHISHMKRLSLFEQLIHHKNCHPHIHGQGCMATDYSPYFPKSFNGASIVQRDVLEEVKKSRPVDNILSILRSLKPADKSVRNRVLATVFANVDRGLYRYIKMGLFVEGTPKIEIWNYWNECAVCDKKV